MNLAMRPPENPDTEGTELHAGRADFLQVFLSQRSQMEALVSRRVGCRATAADPVSNKHLTLPTTPRV